MRPVFCTGDAPTAPNAVWEHLPHKVRITTEGRGKNVTQLASWSHTIGAETQVSFAMTFPFTYERQLLEIERLEELADGPLAARPRQQQQQQQQQHFPRSTSSTSSPLLSRYPLRDDDTIFASSPPSCCSAEEDQRIYLFRETLSYSVEGRRVDMLTITGYNDIMLDEREDPIAASIPIRNTHTGRPHRFPSKKVIVVSARVHPGETPASYIMQGFLNFLMSRTDPRAIAARKHYVFRVVPMLNPDGVVRGHYRTDSLGQNLNRLYDDPDPNRQPSIYAVKQLLLDASVSGLLMYLDIHAHASRRGCFVYGNAVPQGQQVANLLFPKLMSINCPHFDFSGCNFTEYNMKVPSKRDGEGFTKEGTGRVAIASETGLLHSYTLEVSYNCGATIMNPVIPIKYDAADDAVASCNGGGGSLSRTRVPRYTPPLFQSIGRSVGVTMVDMFNVNPCSRLAQMSFHGLSGLTQWMEKNMRSMMTVLTGSASMPDSPSASSRTSSLPSLQRRGVPGRAASQSRAPAALHANTLRRGSVRGNGE
eukprot:PhM_4_TR10312/c0_g1_i1/m.71333